MRITYFRNWTAALALGFVVIASSTGVYGQRWGRGDNDQRRSDQEARRQQIESDRKSRNQQERSDWESRRQQEWSDRKSRNQQERSDWESRRQQEWSDRKSRNQQKHSDWESRRQQEWSDRRSSRDRDDDDDDNRRVYSQRYPFPFYLGNGRTGNYGQRRSRQAHARNDLRKAQKFDRKERRRYEREQRRYARSYEQYRYEDDDHWYYEYDDNRANWKEQVLRTVIGNVIGNRLGGDFNFEQQPYNYGAPYKNNHYRNTSDSALPVYKNYGSPYRDNPLEGDLLSSLPIGDFISQFAGNDFVSELLGNFLAQGYDEGFLAATNARRNVYDDENYEASYTTDDGIYDGYSTSLAENRRIFSEGYELGYRDAMAGRRDYDPIENGNSDLVSLLLGGALGER